MKKKNIRKIISKVTALFLMVLMTTNALCVNAMDLDSEGSVSAFEDVSAEDWFYECVHFCAQNRIMIGVDEQRFDPKGTITRAEFIAALHRLAGKPESTVINTFNDVSEQSYYADAVSWGIGSKVVYGTSEITFSPDMQITREEIACMVARYILAIDAQFLNDGLTAELYYGDFDYVSEYAKESVDIIRREALMVGDNDGMFNPQQTATRAETAMIFMKLQKAIAGVQPAVLRVHDRKSGEFTEHTLTLEDSAKLRYLLSVEGWEETIQCECLGKYELILDDVIYRINNMDEYHQIKYEKVYGGKCGAIDNQNEEVVAQIYEVLSRVIE